MLGLKPKVVVKNSFSFAANEHDYIFKKKNSRIEKSLTLLQIQTNNHE